MFCVTIYFKYPDPDTDPASNMNMDPHLQYWLHGLEARYVPGGHNASDPEPLHRFNHGILYMQCNAMETLVVGPLKYGYKKVRVKYTR